jgi:hypothetical protein
MLVALFLTHLANRLGAVPAPQPLGTNAATGRPRGMIIVVRPFSVAAKSSGSSLRTSSTPLRYIASNLHLARSVQNPQF